MKFKPTCAAIGITNRTEDNKHIIFLDYDNVAPLVIKKDLDMIVDKFGASNFFIFDTAKGIHAISFTKYPFKKVQEIAELTHEDLLHTSIPRKHKRRSTVLRISPKFLIKSQKPVSAEPLFGGIYPRYEVNLGSETSNAHIDYYEKMFKIRTLKFTNRDNNTKLELVGYRTIK